MALGACSKCWEVDCQCGYKVIEMAEFRRKHYEAMAKIDPDSTAAKNAGRIARGETAVEEMFRESLNVK